MKILHVANGRHVSKYHIKKLDVYNSNQIDNHAEIFVQIFKENITYEMSKSCI
jgi:hypothetical protein